MKTTGHFKPAKASIPLSDISLFQAILWLIEYIVKLFALLFSISTDISTERK